MGRIAQMEALIPTATELYCICGLVILAMICGTAFAIVSRLKEIVAGQEAHSKGLLCIITGIKALIELESMKGLGKGQGAGGNSGLQATARSQQIFIFPKVESLGGLEFGDRDGDGDGDDDDDEGDDEGDGWRNGGDGKGRDRRGHGDDGGTGHGGGIQDSL